MKGLIYLTKTSLKNRIKKYIKKPVTYIWVILMALYFYVFIVKSLPILIEEMNIGSSEGFALILSFSVFVFMPANIITYAKRKGLIFRNSDVHFIFTSPVNPKLALLNGAIKNIFASFMLNLLLVIAGIMYFDISAFTMLIYFLLAFIAEIILESSIIILLYGNERLSKKQTNIFCMVLIFIVALIAVFGVYLFFAKKADISVLKVFIEHPFVQCVPIIGWNIAFIRLIFVGATTLNVVCTILFCISTAVLFVLAYRMKCTGEFYEDAMTFADDYEKKLESGRKGEIRVKHKYGKASVKYKGVYAKAIFYRQLLEYKKNRFFIFGLNSLFCLFAGIGIAVFGYFNYSELGIIKVFIVPGVSAYITFIFSGYATKWSKEAANPYTFLIPDSSAKKLFYSTLIEHIRAFVDGLLITLPAAVTLRLNLVEIILSVIVYMCLQANKLYVSIFSDAIVSKYIGNVATQFFRMLAQAAIIAIAAFSAVISGIFIGIELGFVIMIIVSTALTLVMAVLSTFVFERMENIS